MEQRALKEKASRAMKEGLTSPKRQAKSANQSAVKQKIIRNNMNFIIDRKDLNKTEVWRMKKEESTHVKSVSNINVDENLQKVLKYISTNGQTNLPKRNALNIINSIKLDCKRSNRLDQFIINFN